MRTFIYAMDIQEALGELKVNAEIGLYEAQAASRLAESIDNRLEPAKKRSVFLRIFEQFKDALIILLLLAAIISAIIGHDPINAVLIIAILLIAMIINIININKVNKVIRELKNAASPQTRVKREGEIKNIDVKNIVIGDIVMLGRGDIVPADLRLIETNRLRIDESSVTGESKWARKEADVVLETDTSLEERFNIAFMGSVVTYGRGIGVVYAIGKDTQKGKNAIISTQADETRTKLQDNINTAVKTLGYSCLILCAVILIAGILYSVFDVGAEREIPDMIMISLALALIVMSRGIYSSSSVIMATGAQKIYKSNAIVKDLQAALITGSATVICTDKTGTLTQNNMLITRVADTENIYEVTGVGYKSKGHVVAEIMITRNIALMSEIVVLCNDAGYDKKTEQISGDPTEGAMLVFGVKQGHDKQALDAIRPRIHEIPFDPTRKMMSTYNKDNDRVIMYTKGAAEEIIKRSSYVYLDGEIVFMSDAVRVKLNAMSDEFAAAGLRVLACAYKVYDSEADIDNEESELIYVGMMGMTDPPCKEIAKSVKTCLAAGVKIKVITGDHKNTARVITQAFGIIKEDDEILNGYDIDALNDEQLQEKVKTINVFTRVTSEQKLRIINAIKADENCTVAMMGSDFDDVMAVEKSDIGVAMGLSGKDIIKETSKVIITDDSFNTVVHAIELGRAIYFNLRKSISFILTYNFGIMFLVFVTAVLAMPMPLTATQLLLSNLLICVLPALAVGMERKERGILSERPKITGETILNRKVLGSSISKAIIVFLGAFAAYLYGLYVAVASDGADQHILAMSMCFFTLVAGGLVVSFSAKTYIGMRASGTMFRNKYLNITVFLSLVILTVIMFVPGLNSLYTLVSLSADQTFICMLIVLLKLLSFEISKLYSK